MLVSSLFHSYMVKKNSYAFVLVFYTGILLKRRFLIILGYCSMEKIEISWRFVLQYFINLNMIFYELQPAFLHFAMDFSDSI